MFRRFYLVAALTLLLATVSSRLASAQGQAFGQSWGSAYSNQDWDRLYHYPYTFYPHNYWGQEYFRSADSLYYRYPKEMQIPVYNKKWHNYYPAGRPYHSGHHFILDVF